jgi:Reverse transcriptase (RNA-dependent DNA polymerase)
MGLLRKVKIFFKLDIRQTYHRIHLTIEKDCKLTTFSTTYGNYRYKVLLFGLTSMLATFQRFINEKFMKVLRKFVILYLDDILIFSESREEHEKHVQEVLRILCKSNI